MAEPWRQCEQFVAFVDALHPGYVRDVLRESQRRLQDDLTLHGPYVSMLLSGTSIELRSASDALFAFCAAVLRDAGMACAGLEEQRPDSSGFAPARRDLPPTQLLPSDWNEDAGAYALRFYHPDTRRVLVLKGLLVDEQLTLHMASPRDDAVHSLDLSIAEHARADALPDRRELFVQPYNTRQLVLETAGKIEPKLASVQRSPRADEGAHGARAGGRGGRGGGAGGLPDFGEHRATRPGVPDFGFDRDRVPDFSGRGPDFGGGQVGPHHPIFGDPHQLRAPPGVPPGARFDPFGPPMPPEFPRGAPRARAPMHPFGGPDPDHLQMPRGGSDDHQMFSGLHRPGTF